MSEQRTNDMRCARLVTATNVWHERVAATTTTRHKRVAAATNAWHERVAAPGDPHRARMPANGLKTLLAAFALAGLCAGATGVCAAATGLASSAAPHSTLATPTDLRADAALASAHGKPLVLLFSLPDCQYCAVVRTNYLTPLVRAPRDADRFDVRELTLNDAAPLPGFAGELTSAATLAARYKVHVAPAVVMLDRDGNLLAPPLLGGDVAGMYGAYLDRALDDARAALAHATVPPTH